MASIRNHLCGPRVGASVRMGGKSRAQGAALQSRQAEPGKARCQNRGSSWGCWRTEGRGVRSARTRHVAFENMG